MGYSFSPFIRYFIASLTSKYEFRVSSATFAYDLSVLEFNSFGNLIFKLAHTTKKIRVQGELKNQLERASLSIVLNLAEGSGKYHSKVERRRFYRISFGSLREVQAILELINASQETKQEAHYLGGYLYKLAL